MAPNNRKGAYRGLTQNLVERSEINTKIEKAKGELRREIELTSKNLQYQIDSLKERDKERTDNLSVMMRWSISGMIVLFVAMVSLLIKMAL